VGIHLELAPGDLGVVHLDRALYRRWWRDTTANVVALALKRSADGASASAGIRRRWGGSHAVVVLSVGELRQQYQALLGTLARVVAPLLTAAIGCAMLGVVSARVVAMLAARRVSALLRVVGATRGQMTTLGAVESVLVSGLATLLAVVVGWGLAHLNVAVLLRGMLGLFVVEAFPIGAAVGSAVVVVMATAAAGVALGRRSASPFVHHG
jgi:putative ABC transport system permease protein